MSLHTRLLRFIEYTGLVKSTFERKCELSNGAVDKVGENTRSTTISKISKKFPELNVHWLKTGEGEMLKTDIPIINGSELEKEIKELKDKYISVLEENRELRQKLEAKDKSAGSPKLVGKHAATE